MREPTEMDACPNAPAFEKRFRKIEDNQLTTHERLRFQDKLLWALIAVGLANLIGIHVLDPLTLFGHP